MHTRLAVLCVALCVIWTRLAAGQATDFQPLAATGSTNQTTLPPTAGTPLSLYCNITGRCRPCKPEHLQAEACKQSGHAEKLTCVTNSKVWHQVVVRIHRRVSTASQPLHISRSCLAPGGAAAASGSEVGITQHDSDTSVAAPAVAAGDADKPHPREVYITGGRAAGVGGLNVLYFELAMLLVLSGALPAVVIRKRRYVRL